MIQSSVSTVSHTIPKLYLLTNDDEFSLLYQKLEAALATGLIALLQIRRKQILALPDGESLLYEEALQIVNLAKTYNVPVLINDNIALAEKLGIGVHLGQQDGALSKATQSLAPNQIIGRTCHGDITLVKAAKTEGASYAAMGAIFASTTKPNAATILRQQLIEGCQQDIKICVIGGLTAENISELAGLPIAYIAIVGDIMDLPVHQIAMRCQRWQQVLNKWNVPAE